MLAAGGASEVTITSARRRRRSMEEKGVDAFERKREVRSCCSHLPRAAQPLVVLAAAFVSDLRVLRRGCDRLVTHGVLHVDEIRACVQLMRGRGMPERVRMTEVRRQARSSRVL